MQLSAMQFEEVLRRRRMVRNYDPARPVPAEAVERILASALRAPSAGFTQGSDLMVCETSEERARFWEAATPDGSATTRWSQGMRQAPLVVVALAHQDAYLERYAQPDKARPDKVGSTNAWPVPYWHVDTGFVALLVLLSAVDAGLGACFFGIPADRVQPLRTAFGVPPAHTPTGAITIGYAAPGQAGAPPSQPLRRPDEVVHRGRW